MRRRGGRTCAGGAMAKGQQKLERGQVLRGGGLGSARLDSIPAVTVVAGEEGGGGSPGFREKQG